MSKLSAKNHGYSDSNSGNQLRPLAPGMRLLTMIIEKFRRPF
jgi:hypothetical protein